ncbi:MAG: excisionase family DNA-binding protein [Bacteroidaceae bacterium]|nr:excisionase family DNA-binding protein [Bacteroidaceae bacterium]
METKDQEKNLLLEIMKKLEKYEILLESKQRNEKELLNSEEAAKYLGISRSTIWKMTSANNIPFYRPGNGRLMMFEREELDRWVRAAYVPARKTDEELRAEAEAKLYKDRRSW